jgi:hypothetical protein
VNQVHAYASVPAQLDRRHGVDLCYSCYLCVGCTFRDDKSTQNADEKPEEMEQLEVNVMIILPRVYGRDE